MILLSRHNLIWSLCGGWNHDARENISLAARITAGLIAFALLVGAFFVLGGCSGGSGGSSAPVEKKEEELNEGEPGDYKIPKFLDSVFDESKAQGNNEVKIDTSHTKEGYVSLVCNSDARIKFQTIKGEETYTYDVVQGEKQVFPLTCGNGKYTFRVMKNVEDNSYFELYACEEDVKLKDKFQPYLRPNQYADYTEDSECVKIARKMAEESTCESDFISKVYEHVCGNVEYDYDLAKDVPSDYIPEPDKILAEKKGICFAYASLAASMLRSQGIPTKIIFGYVAPDDIYHAWNMFYTKKDGWVTVEFEVSGKEWTRLDLTFSANGAENEFIGDGTNYQDVYQY